MKNTLKQLVRKEAKALLKETKKSELKKLNFSNLDPDDPEYCVYGQITGDCYSKRADYLIQKCANRVYKPGIYMREITGSKLNGPPTGNRGEAFFQTCPKYYSPIEKFIYLKKNRDNGNNKALIKYLKGERKTLNFK